ncbi:ATP-binding protein [Sorangium atrum]|uniref:histidine kinase n=1 Tax=Sorangium atrum TaxID=2995308 RepID=A0ABT5C562_9BACT|nr:ATP-binding protein [Sorangium aterium]MDC0680798.1 ATP-binding protein [Sorangium aterium]
MLPAGIRKKSSDVVAPSSDGSVLDASAEDCLAGGGEMGALMRSIDWSKTKLGPVATWPISLKTVVGLVLCNRFPMLMLLGPEMLQIYNNAYLPILGMKHPASMGAPASEVWAEIWDVVGPMTQSVLDGGPATWSEHLMLPVIRRGFVEEAYFTFSFSPIPGVTERVAGVLVTVKETTEQVLDARQLRMLRDLATRSAHAKSAEEACRTAVEIFAANDADLPFSLLYLLDGDTGDARLAGASGLDDYEGAVKPARVPLHERGGEASAWPLAEAARVGEILVGDLAARFGALPGGRWGSAPEQAIVLPLSRPGQPRPYGFLVGGVSPRRLLDEPYRGLFRLITDQVVTAIANARAYEEERRRAEELAAIDRAKTLFFSNVSHEFRTPLTLMLGPMEDALAAPGCALSGEHLALAHRNALRLLKLVNALLDFSRLEMGRAQASYEPTDLAGLTVDLASAFRSAIERAGLAFKVDCPKLPEPVFVDRDMWEKIVLNLLSNALKFTFDGEIFLSLRARGDDVELAVRDTGTGIPEHELPHLFDRFHRVQGVRTRTHEGSGIGLALVHELVRLHGGSVRAESRPGEGTAFTIAIPRGSAHLPAERVRAEKTLASTATGAAPYVEEALRWQLAEAPAPADHVEPDHAAAPFDPSARILLADDNADMRMYVRRILDERWTVEAVCDGAAALESARRSPPDLVIADVMMPVLDGFGLLRALRADPATRGVSVIMLSARAGEECRVEGLAAGADDYLVKPFSARELVARVATHLQLAAHRRAVEWERGRMYALFEHAPVGIAVYRGADLVVEMANPHFVAMVGHRDVIGRKLQQAFPEIIGSPLLDVFRRVYATAEPFVTYDCRFDLDRGRGVLEESYWSFNLHPMRDAGAAVTRILVVALDVTESVRARKKLEAAAREREELLRRAEDARRDAERANRAKDEFLAMLGHELRNPLAPIVTALHLMRLRAGGHAERERLVIERQIKHLTALVDDLLDVSRITRGKVELKKQRIELAEVVAKAVEQASPLLEQRRHHLTVTVPSSGLAVDGDVTRLAQVVSNLLTNAAKYTESGGEIAVRAERTGGEVVLSVRDDGIGIAPEMLASVFERFVQERQALDRSQGGLGLGLAIVHNLIAMHGGRVCAHSEGRGRGSEFTLRLPAAAPVRSFEAAPARPPAGTQGSPAPADRRRILLVDDNLDAVELLAESLGAMGHTTRVAADGPSALRIAEEFAPDVALLDIGLPVMDGYELARRLREQPAGERVRLIAITGYGQEADLRRSKGVGFETHLVKPIQIDRLTSLIEEPPAPRAE